MKLSLYKKNNSNVDFNNLIKLNQDNSIVSLDINKKHNFIKYKKEKEREKQSFNDESNNKSKIEFLNFEVNQKRKKRRSIFKETFILKEKATIFTELQKKEFLKKTLKFNSFYYYCFSKFKRNKKDKEMIKLFNFAIKRKNKRNKKINE